MGHDVPIGGNGRLQLSASPNAMTNDSDGLDRLLPRHELPYDLEIRWNIVQRRRFLRRRVEESASGHIRDLSLDGALIEVPLPSDVEIGSSVVIEFRSERGVVVVRDRRTTAGGNAVLYGVQIATNHRLQKTISDVVGQIQGRCEHLQQAWERAR